LASSFVERKLTRELEICELARRMLSFCLYRRAAEHLCYVRPASHHAVFGARHRQTSCIVIDVASPMHWYEEIYRRGLAVVSGSFVFEIFDALKDGALIVFVGRQGRGCSLVLAHALASPLCGTWQLSRKGLPGKYLAASPSLRQPPAADDYYLQALRQHMAQSLDVVISPTIKPEEG
jgi:hypothetical protein